MRARRLATWIAARGLVLVLAKEGLASFFFFCVRRAGSACDEASPEKFIELVGVLLPINDQARTFACVQHRS